MFRKYILTPLVVLIISLLLFFSPFWHKIELLELDLFHKISSEQVESDVRIINLTKNYYEKITAKNIPLSESLKNIFSNLEMAGAKQILFRSPSEELLKDKDIAEFLNHKRFLYSVVRNEGLLQKEILPKNYELKILKTSKNKVYYYPLYEKNKKDENFSLGIKSIQNLKSGKNKLKIGFTSVSIGEDKILKNYKKSSFMKFYSNDLFKESDAVDLVKSEDKNRYERFKNKIVIIGEISDFGGDRESYAPSGKKISNNEIHANFIEMSLKRQFIHNIPYLHKIVIIFLLTLISFFVFSYIDLKKSVVINIILILTLGITSYKLFLRNDLYIEIIDFSVILIMTNIFGFLNFKSSLKKRLSCLEKSFGNKISSEFLEKLKNKPNLIKNKNYDSEVTVLQVKIPNYFSFVETLSGKFSVAIIREYYLFVKKILVKYGAYIENEKDGVVRAIFGFPNMELDTAYLACKAALNLQNDLDKLNKRLDSLNMDNIKNIEIAIDTDDSTIGNTLTPEKWRFEAFGKVIKNTTNLIEKISEYKIKIIMNEKTYLKAEDKIISKKIGEIKDSTKLETNIIYELEGIKE